MSRIGASAAFRRPLLQPESSQWLVAAASGVTQPGTDILEAEVGHDTVHGCCSISKQLLIRSKVRVQ